jgi:hypothetical protein
MDNKVNLVVNKTEWRNTNTHDGIMKHDYAVEQTGSQHSGDILRGIAIDTLTDITSNFVMCFELELNNNKI